MKKHLIHFLIIISCYFYSGNITVSATEHEHHTLPKIDWTFSGFFGVFKREQLQRGYQVYKEVCSACHGIKRVSYRNLNALGFSEAAIKVLAAEHTIQDGPNAEGKMFERPALPKDAIVGPFPNDNAARAANNGALPLDLSLIVKARVGGADYVHAILNGFTKPPAGVKVESGRHYNAYFPGNQISMAQPLQDGQVKYSDGTVATIDQMSKDVVTFLAWAAEPEMEERKQLGVKVFLYLLLMTGLFYATMRRIWKRVH
jgi:ubiquinol-cytochrome c reductase cytochrome c1 subunit